MRKKGARKSRLFVIAYTLGLVSLAWLAVRGLPLDERPLYLDPSAPIHLRVHDLLQRMTLEEKVAQTVALWQQKELLTDEEGNFVPEKARAVLKHGIGQIARASEDKDPRENALFTNALQRFLVEETRLGIPAIVHEEALHGYRAPGATSFPQAIALASTWDVKLVERVFQATAAEMRARGGHQALTPVLDVARDPRWGRTEETYGEDPYLVSRMGVACVRGFQGSGPPIDNQHIIATTKHFAVHGQPEGGINVAPGNYSERIVRQVFLAPFRAAITEAGAMSVMASYNEIDGIPAHANRWLLRDILRQEWGFEGFVVSDYFAIRQLETLHHVAGDGADAARQALQAGVDIELPDPDAYLTLADQVRQGRISEAALNAAVARLLRAKFLLSLFENPYVDPEHAVQVSENPSHRELALEAARKAIILLKNENELLPLDPDKLGTIAVIGPNAAVTRLGGYSGEPPYRVSILEGIRNKAGTRLEVLHAQGARITLGDRGWYDDLVELPDPEEEEALIAEAVEIARRADVAIVAVGGNEQTSREAWSETHLGDRASLQLVGQQTELVRAVVETGTPTVVVLIHGRPLAINYIAEHVPAILDGWYLGQETGTAVADVLFGDYNPAGRLPITYPRSVGQLPVYYNHKPSARRGYLLSNKEPLFPFGHGLSYTSFRYVPPEVEPAQIGPAGEATVRVEVTNTGERAGEEVVQLYLRDQISSVTRPVKELKGFQRLALQPGETRTVEFTLTPETLGFLNEHMEWVVEPGSFEVMVGGSSKVLTAAQLEVVTR